MSVEAVTWALKQPIKRSSSKFIFVILANCVPVDASEFMAFASAAYLSETTSMDRKTVLAALQRLEADGYIADTGERCGRTRQVIVWRLTSPNQPTVAPQAAIAAPMQDATAQPSPVAAAAPLAPAAPVIPEVAADPVSPAAPTAEVVETAAPIETTPATPAQVIPFVRRSQRRVPAKKSVAGGSVPAGTRIASDWVLPPQWRVWARTERPTWSDEDFTRISENFRDTWLADASEKAYKDDWFAAWRLWLRNEHEPRRTPQTYTYSPTMTQEDYAKIGARVRAEARASGWRPPGSMVVDVAPNGEIPPPHSYPQAAPISGRVPV